MRMAMIRMKLLRLNSIDDEKHTFEADVLVQITWPEYEITFKRFEDLKDIKLEKHWNPKLTVSNALAVYRTVSRSFFFIENEQVFGRILTRVRGLFPLHYSSAYFPFEEITVPFYVTTELPTSDFLFKKPEEPDRLSEDLLDDSRKWQLNAVCNVNVYHTDSLPHVGLNNLPIDYIGKKHSVFFFRCKIRRRYKFHLISSFLWQTLLTHIAFTAFCINMRLIHFRLTHSVAVLFLTAAWRGFKLQDGFINLNAISYEEIYFLMSWMMQFLLCIWHVFSSVAFYNSVYMERIDRAVYHLFKILYFSEIFAFMYVILGAEQMKQSAINLFGMLKEVKTNYRRSS